MGLPIHDTTSSAVNLARMVRDGLDRTQDMTSIRTETLRLLLDTLINLGAPKHHVQLEESAGRSLQQMIAPLILDQRGRNAS